MDDGHKSGSIFNGELLALALEMLAREMDETIHPHWTLSGRMSLALRYITVI